MPQGNVAGGKKKKKGRAPKHQNSFAFKHNPGSKKTEKILSSPNTGVCRRCHDKIEWRKKYRKYKPRSQPGKCNLCCQKNIMAAYHTICTNCAGSDKAIDAMEQRRKISTAAVAQSSDSAVDEASTTTTTPNEDNDDNTAVRDSQPTEKAAAAAIKRARRRLRVCAMCTSEPALSKYSNGDAEDEHLIEEIHLIEDKIEDGIADNGKKLTLREIKTLERKIEKLHSEIKERRRQRKEGNDDDDDDHDDNSEEQDEASGGEDNDSEQFDDEEEDEANDPFLLAVGGKDKLLVGEEYQKMLLARETR